MQLNILQKELYLTTKLASPLVAALLAQMAIEIVNTLMLGRLGHQALAGGSLGIAMFITMTIISTGLFTSTGILISRSFGAGKHEDIARTLNQALYLALFLSIPFVAILWNASTLLLWIGEPADIVSLTAQFTHALVWGVPPLLAYLVLREFVCALSFTKIIMFLALLTTPLAALTSYILMYGKWGFPALGIAGVGYSTALMEWCLMIVILIFIFNNKTLRPYFIFHQLNPVSWIKLKEMVKLSIPVSMTMGLEASLFSVTTLLMGYFGADALAAHQIAMQCSTLAFMFPLGVAQATAIRVGQKIGEGSVDRAKYAGYVGLILGGALAIFTAVIFLTVPTTLIHLFIDVNDPVHQSLVTMAISFMTVLALFQLLDAMQAILNGALRGLKDTFVPMWLGLFSYWVVGLLSGYSLAFLFNLGGIGLWWGLGIGVGVAGVLLLIRFYYRIRKELFQLNT